MNYVISDVHGCYDEFLALLEKIDFKEEDNLYLLGDLVDRGPKPVEFIEDLMGRMNVYPILGNHDYMALRVLKKLNVQITRENAQSHLSMEDMEAYLHWAADGGDVTVKQFKQLLADEKEYFLEYLEEASLFEEVYAGGKRFVLVHAGLANFSKERELDDYDLSELIFQAPDYEKRYYDDENTYLVTGHTPTLSIPGHEKPEVYQKNGHIAIDCGCVFGGRMAAYCLETGESFYIDFKKEL